MNKNICNKYVPPQPAGKAVVKLPIMQKLPLKRYFLAGKHNQQQNLPYFASDYSTRL
jgi:hypothetical protein